MKKKQAAAAGPPLTDYAGLLWSIKERIRAAQVRATLAANAELIHLYWDIGQAIAERQQREGWGAAVIPRLARDIANAMPEVKGFSERNIKYMLKFAREYGGRPIVQQPAAQLSSAQMLPEGMALPCSPVQGADAPPPSGGQTEADPLSILQQLAAKLPWFHHILLMEKVKDLAVRLWYMRQTIEHGWSRNILALQIDGRAHERQGKAIHNFRRTLPPPQSDLAEQALKDPYIFDFRIPTHPRPARRPQIQPAQHRRHRGRTGTGPGPTSQAHRETTTETALGEKEAPRITRIARMKTRLAPSAPLRVIRGPRP